MNVEQSHVSSQEEDSLESCFYENFYNLHLT